MSDEPILLSCEDSVPPAKTCGQCKHWVKLALQQSGECRATPPDFFLIGPGQAHVAYRPVPPSFPACGLFESKDVIFDHKSDPTASD